MGVDGLKEHGLSRQWRSRVLSVSVSGVLAATSLAACSSGDDAKDYHGVCVDESTRQRVDDDRCDESGTRVGGVGGVGGLGWLYYGTGTRAPAIGERVSGGTATPPQGSALTRGGVPGDGASISRGGFGGGSDTSVGG